MSAIVKFGAWFLILVTVVTPLYELADFTEAWPHDEDFVISGLILLLIGMALVSRKPFEFIVAFVRRRLRQSLESFFQSRELERADFEYCFPPRSLTSSLLSPLRI